MKKLLIFFFVLMHTSAWADNVSLQFKAIKIPELCELVLKGILKKDYVITPDVINNNGILNLSVKSIDKANVLEFLMSSLTTVGVVLTNKNGIYYLEKAAPKVDVVSQNQQQHEVRAPPMGEKSPEKSKEEDNEVGIYFPKYRTGEMLQAAAKSVGATVDAKDGKRDVVIFTGSHIMIEKVAKLLNVIDQPQAAVHVKAALLEITDSNQSVRSVNAFIHLLNGRLGLNMNIATGSAQPNSLQLRNATFDAVLSAVDGDNRFHYISEPSIRVLDGETAKLTIGVEVPIRGQQTADKAGNIIQGIEYRTAGVVISIEPRIMSDSIILKINHQVSSFAITTTSGIDSPTMKKREASTVIDAREGEVILIAGLDESTESNNVSSVPWLPSLFDGKRKEKGNTHLLLMFEVQRHIRTPL